MMKGKTILPLFVLTSLLSGCITTRLSDKIEKSEGNSIFAVDSLYAISPNSGGAEKGNQLTLRWNKYSYRITSGAEAFSVFLEKQNARQALNNDQISVNVEFSTFQIDGSNKFSSNGPLEISYAFSEKRRKPSPNTGGDIRRKARRALKINQALTDSERRL